MEGGPHLNLQKKVLLPENHLSFPEGKQAIRISPNIQLSTKHTAMQNKSICQPWNLEDRIMLSDASLSIVRKNILNGRPPNVKIRKLVQIL